MVLVVIEVVGVAVEDAVLLEELRMVVEVEVASSLTSSKKQQLYSNCCTLFLLFVHFYGVQWYIQSSLMAAVPYSTYKARIATQVFYQILLNLNTVKATFKDYLDYLYAPTISTAESGSFCSLD